jgi:hypothetical protein
MQEQIKNHIQEDGNMPLWLNPYIWIERPSEVEATVGSIEDLTDAFRKRCLKARLQSRLSLYAGLRHGHQREVTDFWSVKLQPKTRTPVQRTITEVFCERLASLKRIVAQRTRKNKRHSLHWRRRKEILLEEAVQAGRRSVLCPHTRRASFTPSLRLAECSVRYMRKPGQCWA